MKTVGFNQGKYVGDPINAVRIFNEKEADELIILDIDATVKGQAPDLKMIQVWAAECRMPLCYGGGVKTVEQAKSIISLGVEKVALSSAAVADPRLVSSTAQDIGSQSVVVILDVRKAGNGRYSVWTHNGTKNTSRCPVEFSKELQKAGVGEIVLNSIDRDGEMTGYDFELVRKVRDAVSVPMSVLGGAGSLKDIGQLISNFGIIGAAAGSLFVFKGPYKAVLINYPTADIKDTLVRSSVPSL